MARQQHGTPPREHTDRTGMRSALWLPIFDVLADPAVVARLAAEAEEAGWHGLFVWDHLRWRAPVRQVADPWITLAAIATATDGLRLGPLVTPLARRRPAKVARETATLDRLSGGRLTLGVGLGSDRFGSELSKTGEQLDDRLRGQMLDEALEILTAAWSGEPVHHRGEHYTVEGIQFLPRPVQQPGVPVCGPRDFPGTSNRCAGPPGTTASSRSTSNTRISSPKSSPPSPTSASTRQRRTTSPSPSRPAPTQRPTPRRAPPGGWRSSRRRQSHWTRCAACSATARRQPEPSRMPLALHLASMPVAGVLTSDHTSTPRACRGGRCPLAALAAATHRDRSGRLEASGAGTRLGPPRPRHPPGGPTWPVRTAYRIPQEVQSPWIRW